MLRLVALEDRRNDLISTFSGGMARRLEIARGMLHTPAVLFLDEPTIGLDPQTRALMWEDVLRLRREEEVTIFFTTHYMDEAEYADRIAIIDQGAIVALDTPDELKRLVGADTVESPRRTTLAARAWSRFPGGPGRSTWSFRRGRRGPGRPAHRVAGVPVSNVHVHRPTLDDVFLHFTGRQIREDHAEHVMPLRHARAGATTRRLR